MNQALQVLTRLETDGSQLEPAGHMVNVAPISRLTAERSEMSRQRKPDSRRELRRRQAIAMLPDDQR